MASGSSSESDKEMRFSDEKLTAMSVSFDAHRQYCEEQFTRGEERFNSGERKFDQLIEAQTANTSAITSITKDIASITTNMAALVEETREIVQLHKDFKGVARIGSSIQSFGLWLMKWPLIGAGVYACGTWLMKNFSS